MYILGLSGGVLSGNQDGAAALIHDGKVVCACEEERLIGIKFASGLLPKHAIHFCLKNAGITIQDVDGVVFAGETYKNFKEILKNFFTLNFGHAPEIKLVNHHLAHAASSYYNSSFDE